MAADREPKEVTKGLQLPILQPSWSVVAIGLALLTCPKARATDRFFHDLEVESPNGRYVLEAKSPDNKGGKWRVSFQADFAYRMTDREEDRDLWYRIQPAKGEGRSDITEGPPVAIYVSDQGWAVIRTADVWGKPIELIAMSPDGVEKIRVSPFRALEAKSMWRYTSFSTAGLMWGSSYCHFYFVQHDGAPYFCMRAWWDNRLVLDLDAGKQVQADPDLEARLVDAEKTFVLKTLEGTKNWVWKPGERWGMKLVENPDCPTVWEGLRAIHMAGRMKLREAVPMLQDLEGCQGSYSSTSSHSDYEAAPGEITPHNYRSLTIRQLSQLSLRRIGMRPAGYQAIMLSRRGEGYFLPEDPLPFRRETRVSEIRLGHTPEQVVEKIGGPDFIRRNCWVYDIDDATPFTLHVFWDAEGVSKMEERTPPHWHDGVIRDSEFTH
jgi:hypothetical protein